jgi:hypothetical protein
MMTLNRASLKRLLVPGLLLWVLLFGIFQAWNQTLTSDESIHTASAYLAITRGDHRFDPEHPFLFKYLTALPFLVYHTNLPKDDLELWDKAAPTLYDSWRESRKWSDHWVYESGNNAQVMQMLMRIPGIIVMTILCWFIWWLARKWYSKKIALWALFFTAFNATILAHGYLTNTDVPLALTYMLVIWRVGEYGKDATRRNAAWVGLTFSIAMLTKYSAVALIPALAIWLVGVAIARKIRWYNVLADAVIVLAIFFSLAWIIYFFQSPVLLTVGDYVLAGNNISYTLGAQYSDIATKFLHIGPHILPSAYLKGLLMTLYGGLNGRGTFLLGHNYYVGVWFYFPTLFLIKNQLIIVILSIVALVTAIPKIRKPRQWSTYTWAYSIVGGVFLALAIKSKLNLGIRHIMPLMPILSIVLAGLMVRIQTMFQKPYLMGTIILATVLPILVQSGNLIGFGNSIIDRSHYFVDSNLDWGQSWQRIADTLKTHFPNQPVYLQYYTSALGYYAPHNPQYDIRNAGSAGPGVILVAANDLRGGSLSTYEAFAPDYIVDNGYFLYHSNSLQKR